MPGTEAEIQAALKAIEDLLKQIEPLRQQYARTTADLKQVRLDYNAAMQSVNAEADRLEDMRRSLEADFQRRTLPPPSKTTLPVSGHVTPPQPTLPGGAHPDTTPATESLRLSRKRAIADYISFVAGQSGLIENLNALLANQERDVGDMLEIIPWNSDGALWAVRTAWETPEAQLERLQGWRKLLEDRLVYWRAEVSRQEEDFYYGWLEIRAGSTPEAWQQVLQDEADKLAQENAALSARLAEMRQELARREGSDG